MAKWGEIKCARCAALEERLEAAQRDAKEAEAYAEELEAKLAAGILVEYDDGSRIFLSSYAGGAATGGAWSELTLLEEAQDGTVRLRRYTADGDWSAAAIREGDQPDA